MNIRLANEKDLEQINKLFKEVIYDLKEVKKIDMLWGDIYPFCEFENDILNHEMYVIEDENKIIGSFTLSSYDDPDYKNIEWLSEDKKFLYLNRLVILPTEQGKGYAKHAMKFIEKYAINNNYDVIRLVVYKDNKYAIGLYKKLGFIKVEKGYFQLKDKVFNGYEKNI